MREAAWSALADPHRRAILDALRTRPQAVGELAESLSFSQPAMSKHLRVLRDAGLVSVRAEAQRRIYAVDPDGMAELDAWLAPYRQLWNDRLDALSRHLDQSHLDQSHLDQSHLDQSHLDQSHLDQSHLDQSHLDQSHLDGGHLDGGHLDGDEPGAGPSEE